MKKIDNFMLPEQFNELYTKEAISSISLTRDIADKINELIDTYNKFSTDDTTWKLEQESNIRQAVVYMKDNLLNSLNDLLVLFRDSGFIDSRIEYHSKTLANRVNNLLNNLATDKEIVDIRIDYKGYEHKTAGEAVRTQFKDILNVFSESIEYLKSLLNKRVKKSYNFRALKLFKLPADFKGTFKPLTILTDGIKFKTTFNKDDFKNKTGASITYYVAPNGKWQNTGLTPLDPVGVYQAYNRANENDNIIFLSGEYRRDNLENSDIPVFNKSLNLIGEDGATWINGQQIEPVFDENTGLYRYDYQRNCKRLFDWDIMLEYTKVESVAEVKTTEHSFYNGTEGLYISNLPETRFIALVTVNSFQFTGTDKNYYIENLAIYGGNSAITTEAGTNVTIVNCDLGYNCAGSVNGEPVLAVRGGNVITADSLVHDSQYDGISYNGGCNFIEINCRSFNNGTVNDYSNGSTAHAGAKGIRINGVYFNNRGGNVADVQTDTQSVNLGCIAYDSTATTADYNHGFSIQQAGCTMWLFNCIAFGCIYDFFGVPDTALICDGCAHNTNNFDFSYSGTLTNENIKSIQYYMLRNCESIMQQL